MAGLENARPAAPWIDFEGLFDILLANSTGKRRIIAIAGAPGSGKSTLADKLVARLNASRSGTAELLPMDGYHYDDVLLDELGRRAHKGAPDTFDVGGLEHTLERLSRRDELHVAIPVFDRSIEIARSGARLIQQPVEVVVVEGNYLLLEAQPWARLRRHFDLTVLVDVPETVLRNRLIKRWQGFGIPNETVLSKVDENDLPNGRLIIGHSCQPDYRIGGV